jgi:hypothetical protein
MGIQSAQAGQLAWRLKTVTSVAGLSAGISPLSNTDRGACPVGGKNGVGDAEHAAGVVNGHRRFGAFPKRTHEIAQLCQVLHIGPFQDPAKNHPPFCSILLSI